jgi:hypothetical protein
MPSVIVLSAVMLNVTYKACMLSVVLLNVVMLSVVAPYKLHVARPLVSVNSSRPNCQPAKRPPVCRRLVCIEHAQKASRMGANGSPLFTHGLML